jgi:hypothetical protein
MLVVPLDVTRHRRTRSFLLVTAATTVVTPLDDVVNVANLGVSAVVPL